MKKLIIALFLFFSISTYSQENSINKQSLNQKEGSNKNDKKLSGFHYTLGLNLSPLMLGGYKECDIWGFSKDYNVPFGGNFYLNLLPYHELDYNNKFFLTAYYRYNNISIKSNAELFNLILSYNFFRSNSIYSLKLGAGGLYYKSNEFDRLNYILYLSFHEKLYKNFGAGLSVDFSNFTINNSTTIYDGVVVDKIGYGSYTLFHIFLNFTYRF